MELVSIYASNVTRQGAGLLSCALRCDVLMTLFEYCLEFRLFMNLRICDTCWNRALVAQARSLVNSVRVIDNEKKVHGLSARCRLRDIFSAEWVFSLLRAKHRSSCLIYPARHIPLSSGSRTGDAEADWTGARGFKCRRVIVPRHSSATRLLTSKTWPSLRAYNRSTFISLRCGSLITR